MRVKELSEASPLLRRDREVIIPIADTPEEELLKTSRLVRRQENLRQFIQSSKFTWGLVAVFVISVVALIANTIYFFIVSSRKLKEYNSSLEYAFKCDQIAPINSICTHSDPPQFSSSGSDLAILQCQELAHGLCSEISLNMTWTLAGIIGVLGVLNLLNLLQKSCCPIEDVTFRTLFEYASVNRLNEKYHLAINLDSTKEHIIQALEQKSDRIYKSRQTTALFCKDLRNSPNSPAARLFRHKDIRNKILFFAGLRGESSSREMMVYGSEPLRLHLAQEEKEFIAKEKLIEQAKDKNDHRKTRKALFLFTCGLLKHVQDRKPIPTIRNSKNETNEFGELITHCTLDQILNKR